MTLPKISIKFVFTLLLLGALSACSTIVAGSGETQRGIPITGQYVVTQTTAGSEIVVSFLSASQATCQGKIIRANNQLISKFPVSCDDNRTGTASFTSDFINYRDTVIYRLSNGERGKLVFGATTAVSL